MLMGGVCSEDCMLSSELTAGSLLNIYYCWQFAEIMKRRSDSSIGNCCACCEICHAHQVVEGQDVGNYSMHDWGDMSCIW